LFNIHKNSTISFKGNANDLNESNRISLNEASLIGNILEKSISLTDRIIVIKTAIDITVSAIIDQLPKTLGPLLAKYNAITIIAIIRGNFGVSCREIISINSVKFLRTIEER